MDAVCVWMSIAPPRRSFRVAMEWFPNQTPRMFIERISDLDPALLDENIQTASACVVVLEKGGRVRQRYLKIKKTRNAGSKTMAVVDVDAGHNIMVRHFRLPLAVAPLFSEGTKLINIILDRERCLSEWTLMLAAKSVVRRDV